MKQRIEKLTAQERLIAELIALCNNHFAGTTNKELAEKVGTSAANICRDLAVFEKFELADRDNNGRWRMSPKFAGFAGQIAKSYKTARLELSRDEERYMTAMQ